MAIIKPEDITFIFENTDKTATIGLKGGKKEIVSLREANELSKLMNKREKEVEGFERATGRRVLDQRITPTEIRHYAKKSGSGTK